MKMIEKYSNKSWIWSLISNNQDMEMVEKYPDKHRHHSWMSKFIKKFQNKLWKWDWDWISENTNLTMEIIEKYIDSPWDWNLISRNPNTTMEFIKKYPNKPWNWYNISNNPNNTMEIIEKYIDLRWEWSSISRNQNITMEFIGKYPDKPWNWFLLSNNKFTKEKELFYSKYYRIYLATFRLQQYFNRMYDNPQYLFCRNRLDKLFSEEL